MWPPSRPLKRSQRRYFTLTSEFTHWGFLLSLSSIKIIWDSYIILHTTYIIWSAFRKMCRNHWVQYWYVFILILTSNSIKYSVSWCFSWSWTDDVFLGFNWKGRFLSGHNMAAAIVWSRRWVFGWVEFDWCCCCDSPCAGLPLSTWHRSSRHRTSPQRSHLSNRHFHPLQKCQADKVSGSFPSFFSKQILSLFISFFRVSCWENAVKVFSTATTALGWGNKVGFWRFIYSIVCTWQSEHAQTKACSRVSTAANRDKNNTRYWK